MSATQLEFRLKGGRVWSTTVILPSWKGYQSRRGAYGSQDQEQSSDGTVEMIFAPEGRGTEPLNEQEISAIRWVVENETSVSEALIASLFNEYPSLQARYEFVGLEKDELMPDIELAEDLRSRIGLHTIYVHQVLKDGIPYVGFELGCTWETEHGLGILMHGTRTVEIGYADTAFLRWIAEKDRDLPSMGREAPERHKWPPISRKDGWAKDVGGPLSEPNEQEFFRVAGEQFSIVGPLISRADIDAVFPEAFPGKGDLVEFYLRFNGGSRTPTGCVVSCANPEHQISHDQIHKLNVEGFRSIPLVIDDRMLPFANMLMHHDTIARIYSEIPEIKIFLEEHMEIAFDHSGNDLCIHRRSGRMFFMDWESYKEGAVEVAPSFREFIERYWNVAYVSLD